LGPDRSFGFLSLCFVWHITVHLFVVSFVISDKKTAPRDRTTVRLFVSAGVSGVGVTRPGDASGDAVTADGVADAVTGGILIGDHKSTFSIFFWLQIANFDVFLFHIGLLILCWFVDFLCYVRGTEQQVMPACDVLFGNQVIQTNQSLSPALGPLTSWLSGGRIFFVLRFTHGCWFVITIRAKF
jgi:hypothetical protein